MILFENKIRFKFHHFAKNNQIFFFDFLKIIAFGETAARKQVQVQPWNGKCLEANARYAHPEQCDMYVECSDGIPEEKVCADGLFFNDKAGVYTFPCTYPIDVNCTTRARLQAAQVSI